MRNETSTIYPSLYYMQERAKSVLLMYVVNSAVPIKGGRLQIFHMKDCPFTIIFLRIISQVHRRETM